MTKPLSETDNIEKLGSGSDPKPVFYWKSSFSSDLIAGLTGATLGIPQAIAFAIIAGMPPVYGLYTAMIACPLAAIFGSSKQMISGPTTAISIVLCSIAVDAGFSEKGSPEFIATVLTLTILCGVFQLIFGLAGLGRLTRFIPHPVVLGFTAGAGALIVLNQLPTMLGIDLWLTERSLGLIPQLLGSFSLVNSPSALVGVFTLFLALVIRFLFPKKRAGNLFALILGCLFANLIGGAGVGIEFVDPVVTGFPVFSFPDLSWPAVNSLLPGAFTLAVVGLVEAVAIAKSISKETGQKIDSDKEFVGQGVANFFGSFFGCFAGSGSFTRSAINLQSGASTPFAAVFAAILIGIVTIFFGDLSRMLAMPALAAVIVVVGANLVKIAEIKEVANLSNKDFAVLLSTFLSTLIVSLEVAIYFGVILSLFFALQRLATPVIKLEVPDPASPGGRFYNLERRPELQQCPQLKVVRVDGGIYYGSIDEVEKFFKVLSEDERKFLLLDLKGLTFIDLESCKWLEAEAARKKAMGGGLFVCGMKKSPRDFLRKTGVTKTLESEYFFQTKGEAINYIFQLLDKSICQDCEKRVFKECLQIPENLGVESTKEEKQGLSENRQ